MAITLVLHEATRTGAPRIGGLIARELAKREETRVIVMKNGPLTAWLADRLGADNMTIVDADAFSANRSFEARLQLAETLLAKEPSDVVYVNSLASSVFTFAAARLGKKSILHVHEKMAEMINLLRHQITKIETLSLSSGLVLAAGDVAEDLTKVFEEAAGEALNFGVAVDFAEVRAAAEKPVEPPVNAIGSNFERRDRLVVGMCGHASPRKGVDIFFEVAEALPECEFLWIGSWSPEQTDDNIMYDRFLTSKLANLYVSGSVDNPYAYMRDMDVFFLSSREDPNPLVLAEAMVLGVPLLCFSRATAVGDWLGRTAILCHGAPNAADAIRVLRACRPEQVRSESFRRLADRFIGQFDVKEKVAQVWELIARARGAASASLERTTA
jgi:glycosyltransferase involved in cell wall biosynthesis